MRALIFQISTMIVDANIATYWCVPGAFAVPASRILQRPRLIAPSLIRVETANALLKYLRAGMIAYDQMQDGIDGIGQAISEFVDEGHLVSRAAEIAFAENHKVYDCLYLALALDRRQPFATADRRLASLARKLSIETELIEPSS